MAFMDQDDDRTTTWTTIGRGLTAVSVLSITAGVIMVFGDTGVSVSDQGLPGV